MNMDLKNMGLDGEGLQDERVWIVKTHHPEMFSRKEYNTDRCILLVRNPLDAMVSYFMMNATGTQDCTMPDSEFKKWHNNWTAFIE